MFSLAAALLSIALSFFSPAQAANSVVGAASSSPVSATSVIRGQVTDEVGKPVPDASVQLQAPEGVRSTVSNAQGSFVFGGVGVGSYYVQVSKVGYQTQQSSTIYITEVATVEVNVALQRSSTVTLGRITVSASRGVQTSPVIYNVVSKDQLDRTASFRLFDRIAQMPQINAGQYNSAAPGDNSSVNLRGVGALETVTLIDGHPATISNSQCGCFEYNVAPSLALKAVDVTYGSGAVGLYGVNAIAGVIDMQTVDPTRRPEATLTYGIGSYADSVYNVRFTGTDQKWGYAFNYGRHFTDGPLFHQMIYNPSTSPDPSDPTLRAAGTYPVDMGFFANSILGKVRYSFTPVTSFTFSALSNTTWDDKTGNGDNDYNPYDTALTNAQLSAQNSSGSCPAGLLAFGNRNPSCYTPQQVASFLAGPQGGGPADQSFRLGDYHGKFSTLLAGKHNIVLDYYHGFYLRNYNRYFQLPNVSWNGAAYVPSFPPNAFWFSEGAQQTGFQISDDFTTGNHDIGFGYYIQHVQEARTRSTCDPNTGACAGVPAASPYVNDGNVFARDIITMGKVTAYVNAWLKRSSLTQTTHLDPRVTFVWHPNIANALRLTVGGGITQPNPTDRFASFVGSGALNPNCGGTTYIGKGPGNNQIPETSSDLEMSYGHQSESGSSVQLTAYRTNLYSQLFSTNVNVGSLAPGYVPADIFNSYDQRVFQVCGHHITPSDLNVGITENLGRSQYKGIELVGSQRLTRALTLEYNYGLQSARPLSLDLALLKSSANLILNSQLQWIPLHKASLGLDYQRMGWDANIEGFEVDANNPLLLPRYYYANGSISKVVRDTKFSLSVNNMFNSWADNFGYFGHGFLPVNQYNMQSPNILLDGYEQFHLPYRRYFFTISTHVTGS
ncbi:MAG: TonB-dependent receptor [Candidatus Eremiobacteraeota bacterium]|nr:TonB-dependent receptor [Candidatus Eremiobacteraeota bacterium]